jgi:hypothetical protein
MDWSKVRSDTTLDLLLIEKYEPKQARSNRKPPVTQEEVSDAFLSPIGKTLKFFHPVCMHAIEEKAERKKVLRLFIVDARKHRR